MASCTSGTQKCELDMSKIDREKKRKYKIPYITAPKDESGCECDNSQDNEEYRTLGPHSKGVDGSRSKGRTYSDSESSDYVSTKKAKFTAIRFPRTKQSAISKLSSSPHQYEQHERGLPKRLANLKSAIENLSDDWDSIMRAPEVSMMDVLQKKIEERDLNISDLKGIVAVIDILHKYMEEKDATILELKEDNAKLREDFAQQVDKVKVFEQWKRFMKSTLELEVSGAK
ncbi:hypothetical protein EYC80_001055 [Monilinia laxa]|uniref:Uncharacterized protein n=1 Tax=Monilinia laxa TaxID=61186 RepID=A0A5N6K806_MONLA|nr:hypothetical protein EYC80_001055 [Monilinia laxa]